MTATFLTSKCMVEGYVLRCVSKYVSKSVLKKDKKMLNYVELC